MYTKGEWKKEGIYITVFGRGTVAITPSTNDGGVLERVANAHLIASAPDLYEELKDALWTICQMCVRLNPQHENCISCEEMERRRQPIHKVEGKQNG